MGKLGWTQATAFIVTGLLMAAFAAGARDWLRSRGGSKWGAILIGLMAVGFIGAGLFVTDPVNGYPPESAGLPFRISLTGRLHRLFSAFVFLGLPGACFAFARIFGRGGERRWRLYSLFSCIAFLALFVATGVAFGRAQGLDAYAGLFQRITLAVGWLWITLLALYMLKTPAGSSDGGARTP
jgi:hypothetical protein